MYETSPCTPLLFPLHEPPESPRDDELAERWIFGLQTLQFAEQGNDLVGFALIIFL